MSAKVHIVADISANGFGHLAQISPILMALAKVRPGLKVTLRTEVDPVICGQFLDLPFKVGPTPPDPLPLLRPRLLPAWPHRPVRQQQHPLGAALPAPLHLEAARTTRTLAS